MTLAIVWHWWIAPLLLAGCVGFVLATVVGYFNAVHKDQYPSRPPRRD